MRATCHHGHCCFRRGLCGQNALHGRWTAGLLETAAGTATASVAELAGCLAAISQLMHGCATAHGDAGAGGGQEAAGQAAGATASAMSSAMCSSRWTGRPWADGIGTRWDAMDAMQWAKGHDQGPCAGPRRQPDLCADEPGLRAFGPLALGGAGPAHIHAFTFTHPHPHPHPHIHHSHSCDDDDGRGCFCLVIDAHAPKHMHT